MWWVIVQKNFNVSKDSIDSMLLYMRFLLLQTVSNALKIHNTLCRSGYFIRIFLKKDKNKSQEVKSHHLPHLPWQLVFCPRDCVGFSATSAKSATANDWIRSVTSESEKVWLVLGSSRQFFFHLVVESKDLVVYTCHVRKKGQLVGSSFRTNWPMFYADRGKLNSIFDLVPGRAYFSHVIRKRESS